jgi:sec-independent protein translocase protein TatC
MSFLEHLDELRRRLIFSLAALIGGFALCYPFHRQIFDFLSRPITRFLEDGQSLAFTKLTEPFFLYLKVSALTGLFLATPVVLWQLWLFIAPGLYEREKRWAVPFVVLASVFFMLGGWFGYAVVFPYVCNFFLTQGEGFNMVVTMDHFFSLLAWTLLGLGLVFELPVLTLLLARLRVVKAGFLWRKAKYAIFGCFLVAALITPTPDVVTMTVVALPMVALYFLSIAVAWIAAPDEDETPETEELGP